MNINEKVEIVKVVLIGESGVGKTSIIGQFVDQLFQEDQQTTIGGTFSTKTIKCSDGITLKLEIWDTAGQERYRSVTKMFYKDANVAILVYDITNKFSFEELKNYWVNQIIEYSSQDIILAIIANKSDLFEHEEVDEEQGRAFAKQIGAIFASISAKNNSGLNDLFLEISKKYSNSDEAFIVEEKEENAEIPKKRKESVVITKATHKKIKSKLCC
jgi:small GTP-binding protein